MHDQPFRLGNFELSDEDCDQDSVPVMIPRSPFRIHPDKSRTSRVILSRFDRRHWWLVDKAVARSCRVPRRWVSTLHHACLEDGTNFILPLTEPREGYEGWFQSLKQAIALARKQWVVAEPDADERTYNIKPHNNGWAGPRWLAGDWSDYVELAFYDHTITSHQQAKSLFQSRCRHPIEEDSDN